jgi:hypothetical protein
MQYVCKEKTYKIDYSSINIDIFQENYAQEQSLHSEDNVCDDGSNHSDDNSLPRFSP